MASNQTTASVQKIANRLVELGRQGKWNEAQDELFSNNASSIEPESSQAPVKRHDGLKAIKEKGKQWQDQVKEYHGGNVSNPVISENHFAVQMDIDATYKDGKRMKMDEVAVYQVKDGKIQSEQFFY